MNGTDKKELLRLIDKLDSFDCWTDEEYRERFGVKKQTVRKAIWQDIREIINRG